MLEDCYFSLALMKNQTTVTSESESSGSVASLEHLVDCFNGHNTQRNSNFAALALAKILLFFIFVLLSQSNLSWFPMLQVVGVCLKFVASLPFFT